MHFVAFLILSLSSGFSLGLDCFKCEDAETCGKSKFGGKNKPPPDPVTCNANEVCYSLYTTKTKTHGSTSNSVFVYMVKICIFLETGWIQERGCKVPPPNIKNARCKFSRTAFSCQLHNFKILKKSEIRSERQDLTLDNS